MNDALEEARSNLHRAIVEFDHALAASGVEDFEPRPPTDLLTHWTIVASWHGDAGDDPNGMTQVTEYSSMAMSWWQRLGLLQAGVRYAEDDRLGDLDR